MGGGWRGGGGIEKKREESLRKEKESFAVRGGDEG